MYVCTTFQGYHLCSSNLFDPVSGLCLVDFINNEMVFKIMQFFIKQNGLTSVLQRRKKEWKV